MNVRKHATLTLLLRAKTTGHGIWCSLKLFLFDAYISQATPKITTFMFYKLNLTSFSSLCKWNFKISNRIFYWKAHKIFDTNEGNHRPTQYCSLPLTASHSFVWRLPCVCVTRCLWKLRNVVQQLVCSPPHRMVHLLEKHIECPEKIHIIMQRKWIKIARHGMNDTASRHI